MFHIAIADDNDLCLSMTTAMMQRYIYENSATDITFTSFHTPFDLPDSVESGAEYDAFLLDIVMPGMSGIEIAQTLLRMGIGVPMIFITSEKQYALDAFRVGATQYLVKGFSYEVLEVRMSHKALADFFTSGNLAHYFRARARLFIFRSACHGIDPVHNHVVDDAQGHPGEDGQAAF